MREWVILPEVEEATALARKLGVHPAVIHVLFRRGQTSAEAITRFLECPLDKIQDPFAFKDMKRAVDRIRMAIERREKILIYGDYDVDGVTGSAILYPVLKELGADIRVHIPHRIEDGYGLNRKSLESWLGRGIKVLITVDNGITGADHIDFLNQKGVDTIIVDHHETKGALPKAYALVSAAAGGGGEASLAACGLAFKLAWALLGDLKKAEEYLDLVTLGTVADLAGLEGENRILLKQGLPRLAKTNKVGLRALMDVSGLSRGVPSFRDVAFGLAPRINAAGRMGSPLAAFKLLTTKDNEEARQLARELDEGNQERQRVERDAFEEAVKKVEADPQFTERQAIVVESDRWHEGVIGIVAARLVERFQKPSIVISFRSGDVGKGSGRTTRYFPIFDSLCACEEFFESFGGHAQACGLSIKKSNVDAFREKLDRTVSARIKNESAVPRIEIDYVFNLNDLSEAVLKDLEALSPFGPGNPKPMFLTRNVHVKGEARKLGRDTFRCWVTDSSGKTTCEAVGFNAFALWQTANRPTHLDLVHQPVFKDFQGIRSVQLELEDLRPAG